MAELSREVLKKQMKAKFEREWNTFMEQASPVMERDKECQKVFKKLMVSIDTQKLKDKMTRAASDRAWNRIHARKEAYEKTLEEMRKLKKELRDREHEIERRHKAMEEEFEKMEDAAGGSN